MNFIKKNLVLVIITLLAVVGGGFFIAGQNDNKDSAKQIENATIATEDKEVVVTLIVKDGVAEKKYELTEGVGKTALEITEENATNVKMSGEGANAFVTGINGTDADSKKNEFWKLVINGKDSEVGAGSYTIAKGDIITWEIDTF